jgi:uncharacterized membrane protein
MWTREELKERAKAVLRRSYWKAFLVSFILALVSGEITNVSKNFSDNGDARVFIRNSIDRGFQEFNWLGPALIVTAMAGMGILVATLIFEIFLANPVEMGVKRFFLSLTAEDAPIELIGYGFKNGRYLNVVKTMFFKNLFIFLWTLLLIIPGIIKAYAYSMVPYILADNPELDYRRALELSEEMTDGEKFNLWVLDLSFIGWYLLGALACGIGILFVLPYVNTTKAELYIALRRKAMQNRVFQYGELNNSK